MAAAAACTYTFGPMNGKSKVVTYWRDPTTRNVVEPYESKFAGWIQVIAEANATDADVILIAEPWVIGDTYEEIVESLSRLGGTTLVLHVVQRISTVADN